MRARAQISTGPQAAARAVVAVNRPTHAARLVPRAVGEGLGRAGAGRLVYVIRNTSNSCSCRFGLCAEMVPWETPVRGRFEIVLWCNKPKPQRGPGEGNHTVPSVESVSASGVP